MSGRRRDKRRTKRKGHARRQQARVKGQRKEKRQLKADGYNLTVDQCIVDDARTAADGAAPDPDAKSGSDPF